MWSTRTSLIVGVGFVLALALGVLLGTGVGYRLAALRAPEAGAMPTPTPEIPVVHLPSTPAPTPVPMVATAEPVRAVWAYSSDYQSATRRANLLKMARGARLSRILVNVYSAGRAHYPSRVAPTRVADSSPDALALFIDEAHRGGIEVHAYLATMVGMTGGREDTILAEHPDWAMHDDKGRSLLDYSPKEREQNWLEGVWLDPGHPEVQDYVERLYREVLSRYALDGVQMDFIRYPSTFAFSTGLYYPPNPTFGYHPAAIAAFKVAGGSDPLDLLNHRARHIREMGLPAYERACWQWDQWRRDQVTSMVRRVVYSRNLLRPEADVTASVIPFSDRAYLTFYQDWPGWLETGLVDGVYLMAYTIDETLLERVTRAAAEFAPERGRVIVGLGVYKNETEPEDLARQIELADRYAGGFSLFSSRNLVDRPALWEVIASTQ